MSSGESLMMILICLGMIAFVLLTHSRLKDLEKKVEQLEREDEHGT